jgi:hypothetical protein
MLRTWTTALFLVLPAGLASAQEREERFAAGSQKAAAEALVRFGQLVSADNFLQMGFESLDEIGSAKLGEPMRQFSVWLGDLRKFEPSMDPQQLLSGSDTLVFPVLVNARERASIVLQRAHDAWEAVSFGAPGFTRLAWETRAKALKDGLGPTFIVRVPALNLYFLGSRSQSELFLVPLSDDRRLELQKGRALPARRVFLSLVPLAREHKGLPT